MIKLNKLAKPKILEDKQNEWTAELLATLSAGLKMTEVQSKRYRHHDIKTALKLETSKKCAYCESKPLHVTYGDVEHISPKSPNPDKTYEWENLTLACDVCNTNKGGKDGIFDPYLKDPSDAFIVYGAFILPKPTDGCAIYTERELDLNRADLIERREKRIRALHDLICLAKNAPDERSRQAIRQDIINNETRDSVEFAAVSRRFVNSMILDSVI